MELKTYQKLVLKSLQSYIDSVGRHGKLTAAWRDYWSREGYAVGGISLVPDYRNDIPGVPHVCVKVPTGGGKTFLACAALRSLFRAVPEGRPKAVVWLVPSDSILTQTVRTLSDPSHFYRRRIDADFAGRVEVLTKEMLLAGQSFSPDTVRESLTVCVLGFSSLRIDSRKKEDRKVFQENGRLMRFATELGDDEGDEGRSLEGAPETALIQALRKLTPVVIVDESHNAKSKLSMEMLRNLNPSFVLDMTATPAEGSNVIAYVSARDLKKESMVKLPVVVYNRRDRQQVIADAIQLRGRLEKEALAAEKTGGAYIRPIVLFQAQPKTGDGSETYEKVRSLVEGMGIPPEQIAVKTADRDDIGTRDLLARDCPVRYIVTVNALKEGWDCPFAYILASLANRSSPVEVEQITGRILRQPYARKHPCAFLNNSYVLTSSDDFHATIDRIVDGLNNAGFSGREYRVGAEADESPAAASAKRPAALPVQVELKLGGGPGTAEGDGDAFDDVDPAAVKTELEAGNGGDSGGAGDLLAKAKQAGEQYLRETEAAEDAYGAEPAQTAAPGVGVRPVQEDFRDEVRAIRLPRFVQHVEADLFGGDTCLVTKESLSENFSLNSLDTDVDFSVSLENGGIIDIAEQGDEIPKYRRLTQAQMEQFGKFIAAAADAETRTTRLVDQVAHMLNWNDRLSQTELKAYVRRVVDALPGEARESLDQTWNALVGKIQAKIEKEEAIYRQKRFLAGLDSGAIVCEPEYRFPENIAPDRPFSSVEKSLYTAELGDMNGQEREVLDAIAGLENVRWWHRVRERGDTSFCLNGFITHYPDFVVRTHSGKTVLVEVKGDYLNNPDSAAKVLLGHKWQEFAGPGQYRYFMVYQDEKAKLDGCCRIGEFLNILRGL